MEAKENLCELDYSYWNDHYKFKEMDLIDILAKIKDKDYESDDFRHFVTNLSYVVNRLSDGGLPEIAAFYSGMLFELWNSLSITWEKVKKIYAEVYENYPQIEEDFLNLWKPDPLLDDLIVSANPTYIR